MTKLQRCPAFTQEKLTASTGLANNGLPHLFIAFMPG